MKKENISDAVIRRLPRYYRQLTDLYHRGIVRTSSHSLGQEMNITASQIRQDFSCFGEFGPNLTIVFGCICRLSMRIKIGR